MTEDIRYNTGETAADLRREYNPEGSVLRRAQLRMTDMLLYLQGVAKEIGVPCRIDGGNVLGALRHGGFIPWDDDVDVVVPRWGYRRLCRYLEEHPHPQYVIQDNHTDPGHYKQWACLRDLKSEHVSEEGQIEKERRSHMAQRYRGLHIDIFPYEGYMMPWLQRLAGKLACVVNFSLAGRHPHLAQLGYNILEWIVFPVFRLTGRLFGRKDSYMHSYGAWFYERFPASVLFPHKDILFEGHVVEGPADPVRLCETIYGDYMSLPPKDKRNRHHVSIEFYE